MTTYVQRVPETREEALDLLQTRVRVSSVKELTAARVLLTRHITTVLDVARRGVRIPLGPIVLVRDDWIPLTRIAADQQQHVKRGGTFEVAIVPDIVRGVLQARFG